MGGWVGRGVETRAGGHEDIKRGYYLMLAAVGSKLWKRWESVSCWWRSGGGDVVGRGREQASVGAGGVCERAIRGKLRFVLFAPVSSRLMFHGSFSCCIL